MAYHEQAALRAAHRVPNYLLSMLMSSRFWLMFPRPSSTSNTAPPAQVWAPEKEVLERAARRVAQTGRVIPKDTLLDTIRAVPASVEKLAPLADYCVRIDNSDWKSVYSNTAPDAPSRKSAEADGDSGVGGAQQFISPPDEKCRGVTLRQSSGQDGVESASFPTGNGVQDELKRLKDQETGVGGRKRTFEPVLPEDFPVLATPGETWGMFRETFSPMKYPVMDLRLKPSAIAPRGSL